MHAPEYGTRSLDRRNSFRSRGHSHRNGDFAALHEADILKQRQFHPIPSHHWHLSASRLTLWR
jgi:hypothetical protein